MGYQAWRVMLKDFNINTKCSISFETTDEDMEHLLNPSFSEAKIIMSISEPQSGSYEFTVEEDYSNVFVLMSDMRFCITINDVCSTAAFDYAITKSGKMVTIPVSDTGMVSAAEDEEGVVHLKNGLRKGDVIKNVGIGGGTTHWVYFTLN